MCAFLGRREREEKREGRRAGREGEEKKKKAVGGGNPQTKIRNFEERYAFEHVCWRRNVVHLFF